MRIAVSGVGGGIGQSIIKALAGADYEVVALDGEPLAAGLYAAATSYVIPYASSPDFVDRISEICQKEDCKLFFPGLDAELPVLSRAVERFAAIGTQLIVSSPEVIALSDNKQLTYETLKQYDISVPETIDMANASQDTNPLPYPFILKPREGGARSKDVYLIRDKADFDKLRTQAIDLKDFVAQEYIEGDEYTCGSINLDGECKGVIVMRRILRDGDTYKCFSVKNDIIETEVKKIMSAIKPFGACNVQLRLRDGRPYVFEINARCSGTTAARAVCGFNEPAMIADYLTQHKEPVFTIKEQGVLRYWNELVVSKDDMAQLEEYGSLNRGDFTHL